MAKLYNLAGMSTSTTGTGTITLGSAIYGHLTFAQAGVQDGDLVGYAVKDGAASEVGYGVYTASGTTLTRTVRKSTNSDAAISLSGSAEVFITPAAEDFLPVSSCAALGLLTNPFFEVSQEHGTTLKSAIGSTSVYPADQWRASENSDGECSTQNVVNPFSSTSSLKRLTNSMKTIATTADASLSSAQYIFPCSQVVEGVFWGGLGWGSSDARAVDVVFAAQCSVTGTYPVAITNAAGNRSYVTTVSLTANTPTICIVRIPGDTGGTWVKTTEASAKLYIGSVGGSDYQASALDTWEAAGKLTHSTCTNWAASGTTDFFQVGYCQIFPAGVLPWSSASEITGEALQQLLNIRRPYDDELRRCRRYYNNIRTGFVMTGHNGASRTFTTLAPEMRSAPVGTVTVNYKYPGSSDPVFAGSTTISAQIQQTTANGVTDWEVTCALNSRM